MLLVTGGAGFIGSNIVASLNEAGRSDIVVNDTLGTDGRWRNLAKRQIADFVQPHELAAWLDGRRLDAVIHMGAISDTTAADGDLVMPDVFGLRDVTMTTSTELESLRLDHWEQKLIREAMSRTNNNIPEAAKLLGIGRATLYRKLDMMKS